MPNIIYGVSLGRISKSVNVSFDQAIDLEVTLTKGQAVSAWVKTDANTAACNLASGHGQTDGKFDVYWSGGRRYGVDGTISTNALSLDGGSGDDFPASATSGIVVCKQQKINLAIDGDNVAIIGFAIDVAASTGYGSRLTFFDAINAGGSAVGSGLDLDPNTPQIYHVAAGVTNPLTGSPILSFVASHGDATYDAVLKVQGGQDVTP
jgi:hypothetical protein